MLGSIFIVISRTDPGMFFVFVFLITNVLFISLGKVSGQFYATVSLVVLQDGGFAPCREGDGKL